jgi:adenylate cyclase
MKKRLSLLFTWLGLMMAVCSAQNAQIDSLKNVLSKANDDTFKVHLLLVLSKKYFSNAPEKAIEYAQQAKQLAEQLNFQKGLAYAYKNIGIGYYWQGNYVEAIHSYQKSLAVFDSLGDKVGIANIQSNIGAIYANEGDDETALDYHLKSLKASEEAKDTFRIITACINIGALYSDKPKTYDKALEYLKRALPLSEAIDDKEDIGNACVNMGEIYFKRNDDTSALRYFYRSLKACENSENMPYSLNAIGKVYFKRKNYPSALTYHQKAYDFANKSGAKLDMAQALLGIAAAQRQSGNLAGSINSYKQAEAMAGPLKANEELKETYEGLASAYAARSDFNDAFKYQNLLTAIKDTLYNIDADKKLQGLQFTFDLEKKESKISLLTKDNEINQRIISGEKLVRNVFIGGFGITLLFAGVFFSQRNKIAKEKDRSDELLLNILPAETAEELKETGTAKTKSFDSVTVMFTDFKNFTQASERLSAEELVKEINLCYSEFDRIVTRHGIEKIKTIGDSYMCAGGLPIANTTHAEDAIRAGLEMQQFMAKHKQEKMNIGLPYFELRLGIHTGPVVAGIVGVKKFAYDIWGDTVNTASRMESSGEVGKVNISGVTYELIKDKFACHHRGKVAAKNKGEIDMYFVTPS